MKASKFGKGFTLIEMMIVVGIVGILAAIAYPSYVDYLRRGAIPEGLAGLSNGRVQMEQFFMDNRNYTGACARVFPPLTTPPGPMVIGKFQMTCVFAPGNPAATPPTSDTYTLTATGITGTLVQGFVYTIDNTNTKQTTGVHANWVSSVTPPLPRNCWILKRDGSC